MDDPPNEIAEALSNIHDDEWPRREALRWAIEALLQGRPADELMESLTSEGWTVDDAEEIVETARKETRRERGVITREDVVRDLSADYRRATAGLSVAFRSGLFGLYGFTTGVMAAIRSARRLKK